MSLNKLILWNPVEILQKHFRRACVHCVSRQGFTVINIPINDISTILRSNYIFWKGSVDFALQSVFVGFLTFSLKPLFIKHREKLIYKIMETQWIIVIGRWEHCGIVVCALISKSEGPGSSPDSFNARALKGCMAKARVIMPRAHRYMLNSKWYALHKKGLLLLLCLIAIQRILFRMANNKIKTLHSHSNYHPL